MISDVALGRLRRSIEVPDFTGTKYDVVDLIGRGGMSDVYRAHDTALDRDVAVKVLAWATPESGAARAMAEARIIAGLEHLGIVPIHDVGRLIDGRVFYAMTLVRGTRLADWLVSDGDKRRALAAFVKICDAIAFAHAKGVVHCDLKPENVMVGAFGEVLVLDWGVARIAGAPARADGVVEGTPDFMAPEQAAGQAAIDARADVHALGVMLAWMNASGPGRPLRAVAAIAAKARAADPAARYQTAAALADDVVRALGNRAIAAAGEPIGDRLARWWRRYRGPAALVGAYLLVRALLLWQFHV